MNVRTGLAAALVAAIVAAVVTLGGLTLAGVIGEQRVALAEGESASQAQVEKAIAKYFEANPGSVNLEVEADRKRLTEIVHDYLVKNPEILVAMSDELDKRQQQAQAEQQKKALSAHADEIYRSEHAFVGGNPKGDVTVVEFFDYNCGFCKRAMPDLIKLIEEDDKVRVVLKELPILSAGSEQASRVALAAMKQGKYFEMHQRLLAEPGEADEAKALSVAEELGLDIEKLKTDMKDPSIDAALQENRELAQAIGLQGTPLYLIGDQIIAGAPEDLFGQLQKNVTQIREHGCSSTC